MNSSLSENAISCSFRMYRRETLGCHINNTNSIVVNKIFSSNSYVVQDLDHYGETGIIVNAVLNQSVICFR